MLFRILSELPKGQRTMDELIFQNPIFPSNIEDLSKFALIGREKLISIRAEIRAIEKLGLAEEVRRQKLEEAQMISEIVLDAEVRIGSLTVKIPKALNQYKSACDNDVGSTTKQEAIEKLGFTRKQIERFETLAKYPEIIEKAKAEARERDDIISRAFVLQKIADTKKPHITQNSGFNEWYTPEEYINAARAVMERIDLDPASCEYANRIIQADTYYTAEDDGLSKEWSGCVWMNPPYIGELIPLFCDKLKKHVLNKDIEQAIVLVNNATETAWFSTLVSIASAIVFSKGRIHYYTPDERTGTPLQGQAFIYIGDNSEKFLEKFSPFGWGVRVF